LPEEADDLNLFANRGSEREILVTPTAISPLELLEGERISVQELTYYLLSSQDELGSL
jgi:hypothetical protein